MNSNLSDFDFLEVVCNPYAHLDSANEMVIRLYKYNKIGIIQINWNGSTGDAYATLSDYTIPEKYRPHNTVFVTCSNISNGDTTGTTRFEIKMDGSITFVTTDKDRRERYCSVAYIINN